MSALTITTTTPIASLVYMGLLLYWFYGMYVMRPSLLKDLILGFGAGMLLCVGLVTCASGATMIDVMPPLRERTTGWFDYDQDNFALGRDDGYTAGLRLGLDRGEWRVTASWAIYTDRDHGRRVDEGLATIQRRFDLGAWQCAAGVGLLISDDLGGARAQHAVHHAFGDQQYDLAYEEARWLPAMVGTTKRLLFEDVAPIGPLGQQFAQVVVRGGFLIHQHELRAQVSAAIIYGRVGDALVALEPLVELVLGEGASRSAETDRPLNVGVRGEVYAGYVHIGMTVASDRSYGTLGIVF